MLTEDPTQWPSLLFLERKATGSTLGSSHLLSPLPECPASRSAFSGSRQSCLFLRRITSSTLAAGPTSDHMLPDCVLRALPQEACVCLAAF